MSITQVQDIRLMIGDFDPALPFLTDDVINYYLSKNNSNTNRAAIECARAVLMMLSVRSDESVDIFSTKSSKASAAYIAALQLFLKDPSLNPVYQNVQGYAGGISVSDINSNNSNSDNASAWSPFLGCTTASQFDSPFTTLSNPSYPSRLL